MGESLKNKGTANLGPNAKVKDLTVTGTLTVSGSVKLQIPAGNTCTIQKGTTKIVLESDKINFYAEDTRVGYMTKTQFVVEKDLNATGLIKKNSVTVVEGATTSTIKVWYAVAN